MFKILQTGINLGNSGIQSKNEFKSYNPSERNPLTTELHGIIHQVSQSEKTESLIYLVFLIRVTPCLTPCYPVVKNIFRSVTEII
jgi:hypothetical protein